MCNPAEQAGVESVDYASDPKRNNGLVPEMDNVVLCADTSANASKGTSKAIDNHSNGSLVENNEAVVHLINDSVIEANGVGHSFGTSEHTAKEVLISEDGQEVEGVDQTREPAKTCCAMANAFSEVDGIAKYGIQIPNLHFKDFQETSGHTCNANLIKFEDDVRSVSAEYRMVETKRIETETLLENMSSETKSSQIEEVKCEEALQTSMGFAGESVTLAGLSDGANGRTSIAVVEALDATSVSGGNYSAAEELLIDSCTGAEKPETQTDMGHDDDTAEVDDLLSLEGLAGASEGHSTGPCTETKANMAVNNADLSLDEKEQLLSYFDESFTWIEMRPGSSRGVAEQIAANSEESLNGAVQTRMNCEETENEIAMGSLETLNTSQQFEKMIKDIVVISEHAETSIHTMEKSSKEDAPRSFKEANEQSQSEIELEGSIIPSARVQVADTVQGNSTPELTEFATEDAADHVSRSFKEANEETPSEIEHEDAIVSSVEVQVRETAVLKGSPPELVEFFNSARGCKIEEIEEQEYAPALPKLPLKKELFMESPRSLRMLLFSDETSLPTKKDEKQKKDGKVTEFSSKVVPAVESHGNDNHTDHNYPAKWYEDADDGEPSGAFSGPIAFSGALTYQGLTSYSGQVQYSGSISHRSDSSTSTRSFAFPILASDWNSSPVKMGAPDPRYYRKRRKWQFCFCCSRPSTLFD